VLGRAGRDPTVVIGGRILATGTNARLGMGELMVAEADESDGTFLLLSPTIVVVTNIDPEHLDFYGDMDRVKSAYLDFINRIPFFGVAVLCLDDVNIRSLLPQVRKRVITYGTSADADYVASGLTVRGMETRFSATRRVCAREVMVRLPGRQPGPQRARHAGGKQANSACRLPTHATRLRSSRHPPALRGVWRERRHSGGE